MKQKETTTKEVTVKTKAPQKREFVGNVISVKPTNTIIVKVERLSRHPLYKKQVKRTKNFAAHITVTDVAVGDLVKIVECKPVSKTKRFMYVSKVTR